MTSSLQADSLDHPVATHEELSLVLRQNVEGEWEIINPEAELPIEVQQRMEVIQTNEIYTKMKVQRKGQVNLMSRYKRTNLLMELSHNKTDPNKRLE